MFINKKIIVIDLALSRFETASESTDAYYLSLYESRTYLSDQEKIIYTDVRDDLYKKNGDIRVIHNDELVNVPYFYFDELIINSLSAERKRLSELLPKIIIEIYSYGFILPSDYLIIGRLLELSNGSSVSVCFPALRKTNLLSLFFCLSE